MAPFAGNGIGAGEQLAADHDAAAGTCAENDAEHGCRAFTRAIRCFRQRKTVGIVCDADRTAKRRLDIPAKGMAIEPGAVRILHEAGRRRDCARHAYADAAGFACFRFERRNEIADRGYGRLIASLRRGNALARLLHAACVQRDAFDFRAAEVYADPHVRFLF